MLELIFKYLHITPICDVTGAPLTPKKGPTLIPQQENGIKCCKLFISFCYIFYFKFNFKYLMFASHSVKQT